VRTRSRLLWGAALPFIKLWIKNRYDLKIVGTFPEPPYILIANHTQDVDPFFLLSVIGKPVSFIINNAVFQNPVVSHVLRNMDMISKQKETSDLRTIYKVLKYIKSGRTVGIFAEGNATWDGVSKNVYGGTSKLLDRGTIPIVAVRISGGYLVNPRWADKRRYGPIELNIKEFSDSSALDHIQQSDWEWQRKTGYLYKGSSRAAGIERIIWFCPACQAFSTVNAKGNDAYCFKCGNSWHISETGFISGHSVHHVVKEQKKMLEQFLKERQLKKDKEIGDAHLNMWHGKEKKKYVSGQGRIIINDQSFELAGNRFFYGKINALNTFMSTMLEFLYGPYLVRIKTRYNAFFLLNLIKTTRRWLQCFGKQ